ncbi:MAG TPA: hypothetical protein VF444_09090 [Pseudonocardiaceae bacterium]
MIIDDAADQGRSDNKDRTNERDIPGEADVPSPRDEQVPDFLRRAISGIRWAQRDGLLTSEEARSLAHRVMAVAKECWTDPADRKQAGGEEMPAEG